MESTKASAGSNTGKSVPRENPVVLISPISFGVITLFSLLVASALVVFALFGTYHRRVTVQGELVPSGGLIRVRPQQTGIVVESRVREGTPVKRGDVLFVLTNELHSNVLGTGSTDITAQIQRRSESYETETQRLARARDDFKTALQNRALSLDTEIRQSETLLRDLENRVDVARSMFKRYDQLRADGFVTEDALRSKEADLLDQQVRLSATQKDLTSLRRMRSDLIAERQDRLTAFDRELAELQRSQALTTQELVSTETKRRFEVRAPVTGTATGVVAEVGQAADGTAILVSIIPENAQLEARLLVPSSAVGFLAVGSRARLRYAAFPYQRYGMQFGAIASISKSAIMVKDVAEYSTAKSFAASDLVYQVNLKIDSQSLEFDGTSHELRSGMAFDADVMLDERRIYEWLFEPVAGVAKGVT